MAIDMFWFNLFWALAFPFIYGQLLSRLFGLKKPLDHWILFCLHISVTILCCAAYMLVVSFSSMEIVSLLFAFILMTALEGLVWQFFLIDRKLNGFLISLICCSGFITPFVIGAVLAKF